MQDDLRILVEEHFPRLAYRIMSSGPRRMNSRRDFGNSPNRVHDEQTNWGRVDGERKLVHVHTDRRENTNCYWYGVPGQDKWSIRFFDIRLVDIDNVDPQPVDVDQKDVKIISLVKRTNNTASFVNVKADKSQVTERSEDHSFAALAEAEFEVELTRSAEASIDGLGSAKEELKTKFRTRVETKTDHEWRTSDRIEDSVSEEYRILPYSSREVTIKEGTPTIRQRIPTHGLLECKVLIDIRDCNQQVFGSLDDIWNCWQGLRGGYQYYSDFFSKYRVSREDIAEWVRPYLNLDIEVSAERVRYSDYEDNEFPIPGKEKLFKKYRNADLEAIKGGSR